MPDGRRFLFVFANQAGGWTAALYHDDPPTPAMLRQLPRVLHKWRLEGRALTMTLGELEAEYRRRVASGRPLPPSNMILPPAEGRKEERLLTPRAELEALVARLRQRLVPRHP